MKISLNIIAYSLVVLAILSGCSHEYYYSGTQEIDENGWAISAPAVFEFETQDTTSYLDFYFDVRNNDSYPYQNIYAFITMKFPNNKSLRDTLHFPYLASDAGKWLGKGIGSAYDNSIMYKHRKKLPLPGAYSISVTHAMRDEVLVGVERVGIHIETVHGD